MNQSVFDTISGAGKIALTTTTLFAILKVGNAQVNAEYFENPGNNLHRHTYSQSTYEVNPLLADGVDQSNGFSTRLTSYFVPSVTGSYRFRLTAIGPTTNAVLYNFSGSPIAYATSTTNIPVTNSFTINANQQFGLVTFVNATGTEAGVRVEYSLDGGAFQSIPTENLREMFNPKPPAKAGILASAPGTLRLFWEKQAGHDSYQIFSSDLPITDMVNPVNNVSLQSQRPVTTYSGGKTLAWRFTNLTNDVPRFTRIRPVKFLPFGLAYGEPSYSLADIPILDPIPWDTENPSLIIPAVRGTLAGTGFDLTAPISGLLPDGRRFEEGLLTIQPPKATNVGGNLWQTDEGAVHAVMQESRSGSRGVGLRNERSGPYRRLSVNEGYWGATGTFFLPRASAGEIRTGQATQQSQSVPDSPCLYFGAKFVNNQDAFYETDVDYEAGLQYHSRGLSGAPRQWFIYLKLAPGTYDSLYLGPNPPTQIDVRMRVARRLSTGVKSTINAQFIWGSQKKFFTMPDLSSYTDVPYIRRVFSIAQDDSDPIVIQEGYKTTGTFFRNAGQTAVPLTFSGARASFDAWEDGGSPDGDPEEACFPSRTEEIVGWTNPFSFVYFESLQRITL
jgi:hypothetical protein